MNSYETLSKTMIRKEYLHDQVVQHIGLRILKGSLTSLPNEAELAKELQVSRSILRESIKVLAAKGLLDVRRGRGMRVRPREDWNLLDPQLLEWVSEIGIDENFFENLSELRRVLEPKMAELAAIRARESDMQEIRSAWDEMKRSGDDPQAYNRADLRFHEAILAASHNELLFRVGRLTGVLLDMSFALTSKSLGPVSASLRAHKDVMDAIVSRNPVAAAQHTEDLIALATAGLRKAHNYNAHRAIASMGPNASRGGSGLT
jgi:GntR family transcriptional regulator, galactonate operon transcriptional repressor